MRARLMIGAGIVAIVAWGCGDDGSSRDASGQVGARAAVVEFSDAFLDEKYDDACDVLSERAKRQFEATRPCPEALRLLRRLIGDAQLDGLRDNARTLKITVTGDKARTGSVTNSPGAKTSLVRQDGRWFIDAGS